jgi:hypothetical protein
MPRPDPLTVLRRCPPPGGGEGAKRARITIQLPVHLSKEIKKAAVDGEVSRDQLICGMLHLVMTNPELFQSALEFAQGRSVNL